MKINSNIFNNSYPINTNQQIATNKLLNKKLQDYKVNEMKEDQIFTIIGVNSPKSVKDAWYETLKEFPELDKGGKLYGTTDFIIDGLAGMDFEGLGNSVATAIEAIEASKELRIYNMKNPQMPRTEEHMKSDILELKFYDSLLEKLNGLGPTDGLDSMLNAKIPVADSASDSMKLKLNTEIQNQKENISDKENENFETVLETLNNLNPKEDSNLVK